MGIFLGHTVQYKYPNTKPICTSYFLIEPLDAVGREDLRGIVQGLFNLSGKCSVLDPNPGFLEPLEQYSTMPE